MAEYVIPKDLYYTRDHAWVKVEGDLVRVGMSDFMQKLAGEITFIRAPRVGKSLAAGANLASIQSGKWAGKVKCPAAVEVVEANATLVTNPSLLNSDCYGEGWICVLRPADLEGMLQELLHGPDADAFFTEEQAKHAKEE